MRYIFIVCLAIVVVSGVKAGFCQVENPFADKLPRPVRTEAEEVSPEAVDTSVLEKMKLEGLFWDTPMPQVIIDGEVYKEDDTIKTADAKIIKIEKDSVKLIYKGRVFLLSPKTGLIGQSEGRLSDE